MKRHDYKIQLKWTGNLGTGTSTYRKYSRNHQITAENRPPLECSSDPGFRGDPTKYNPEQLLVGSLAGCHMLWYLHLCSQSGISVVEYSDHAEGTMVETADGGGKFIEVTLKPTITLSKDSDMYKADSLHHQANKLCFIAQSCNFPVKHEARYQVE